VVKNRIAKGGRKMEESVLGKEKSRILFGRAMQSEERGLPGWKHLIEKLKIFFEKKLESDCEKKAGLPWQE
jgi:hypothetical protein